MLHVKLHQLRVNRMPRLATRELARHDDRKKKRVRVVSSPSLAKLSRAENVFDSLYKFCLGEGWFDINFIETKHFSPWKTSPLPRLFELVENRNAPFEFLL